MEKVSPTLGERLTKAREATKSKKKERKGKCMSQTELAEELDISLTQLRNWEHDRSPCTKHRYLKKYSELSGFTVDYLLGYSREPHADMVTDAIKSQRETEEIFIEFVSAFTDYRIERKGCVYTIYNNLGYKPRTFIGTDFLKLLSFIVDNTDHIMELAATPVSRPADWPYPPAFTDENASVFRAPDLAEKGGQQVIFENK